ncbi:hypothetical protein V499_07791 [Pseudogymnoascus sp. VKM F-103]|nr:hypothetical protein V499_07791 [Pseudogymnoascus sp. VKM F-103]
MPAAPAPEKRAAMEQKLGELIQGRSTCCSEFDNIEAGRALTHPNQFRPAPGTGAAAAKKVYDDVVGRNMMAQMMVTDTTAKTAMLTGSSGPPVDFGSNAKEKVRSLNSV